MSKGDFFDDASSVSDIEDAGDKNKKINFDHNTYEKYSTYYFCYTVLGIKTEDVMFIGKIDINKLTIFGKPLDSMKIFFICF